MPKNQNIIAALDIGSSAIRLAVARVCDETENQSNKINIIGFSEAPSAGFSRGNVNNIEELVSRISVVLEGVERVIGFPIENVVVGISGDHIISSSSRGVIATAQPNGEITKSDISRSIESAKNVTVPPNYEILHVIPKSFNIDSQLGIKDPIGMSGVRLEAEVQIIQGLTTRIKNFTHAVYRTGLEIESIVLSSLATGEATLDSSQKDFGVLSLDIGYTLTKGVIFEEGRVLHTFVLPIGSSHITADLAIGLLSSIETAEKVKLEEGTLDAASIRSSEKIDLKNFSKVDTGVFSRHYITEIIEARVEEIFNMVSKELKKTGRFRKLPSGIVLSGGGSKLPGLVEFTKERLELPASPGVPKYCESSLKNLNDPIYATVCGLISWEINEKDVDKKPKFKFNIKMSNITSKLRKLAKSILP